MPIDMPTMLVSILVVALSMGAAVLASGWRIPHRDGLNFWGQGLLLLSAGFILFALSVRLHNPWLIWLGNVLLAASYASVLMALSRFHAHACPLWLTAGPILLVALFSLVFLHQGEWRVITVEVVLLWQWCAVAASVLRCQSGPLERGRWLLLLGAVLMGLVYAVRIVAQWLDWGQMEHLWPPHMAQVAPHLLSLSGLVFLTLGYVLMTKERADAEFRRSARLDALTGIPNRSAFLDTFQHVLAQAARGNWPVALLMADIDKFKNVNDTYGHLAGDAVLRAVAQRLQAGLRAQDTLGRYGGEEFLVLLPDTPVSGARTLAQHLRQSVEQMVVSWEGKKITVTISVGISGQIPAGAQDAQALIDRADQAMYAAKHAGRNRVEVADALPPPVSAPA